MTKRCTKCGEVKDVGEFSKHKRTKDGLQCQCKACVKAYQASNRERIGEQRKAYFAANRKRNEGRRPLVVDVKKRCAHCGEVKCAREFSHNKIEKDGLHYRCRMCHAAYYVANREHRNEYGKSYKRNRYRTDPSFRLISSMRAAVYRAIRGLSKSVRTMEAIGCTIDELWVWFESQFKDGMTRENYGSFWHVDHYFPLAKTDQADPVQFRASWNYRNLRPEYGPENCAKSDTVYPEAQALFDQLVEEFSGQEEDRPKRTKRVRKEATARSAKGAISKVAGAA